MSLVNRGGYEHECSLCGVEWSGDHPPVCGANKGRPCDSNSDVLSPTTVAVSKMQSRIDELESALRDIKYNSCDAWSANRARRVVPDAD